MTPYDPSYIPRAMPSDIARLSAPQMANPLAPQSPSMFHAYMGSLGSALGGQQGQAAQGMGAAPPPPQLQMAQAGGVHQGAPMDPAAMQSMMQVYKTLQPSGQLAEQMQAAHVPGLLSRFQ